MLICEMVCYYKTQNKSILTVLNDLYDEFGYYHNTQVSFTFEGQSGMQKMAEIMKTLCNEPPKAIANYAVTAVADYIASVRTDAASGEKSKITLPKSDVLEFVLEGGNSVIIRPSGTEPKLKAYISSIGTSMDNAIQISDEIIKSVKTILGVE